MLVTMAIIVCSCFKSLENTPIYDYDDLFTVLHTTCTLCTC